jgi:hypothetical protein
LTTLARLQRLALVPLPERIHGAIALTMLVAFAVTLGLYALDPRVLDNHTSVWAKPLKFEIALALHAGTLALVVAHLDGPWRTGRAMQLVAMAFLAACVIEMGYILFQAARAEQSHFNEATEFHRVMFSAMAFSAVVIIGAAGAVGLAVWRDEGFAAHPVVKAGVVLGLTGGTILTLITAFAIGGNGGPHVGGTPDLAARMPLTGWSRTSGDLRVAHFLATHMIQALPILALGTARVMGSSRAVWIVRGMAGVWVAWTFFEFFEAQGGNASMLAQLPAG